MTVFLRIWVVVFSEMITFSQNISFAFMLYLPVENYVIRKHDLSLLEFCKSKIAIQIVCSCKSSTFILMAWSAELERQPLPIQFVMN